MLKQTKPTIPQLQPAELFIYYFNPPMDLVTSCSVQLPPKGEPEFTVGLPIALTTGHKARLINYDMTHIPERSLSGEMSMNVAKQNQTNVNYFNFQIEPYFTNQTRPPVTWSTPTISTRFD